jgi:hypothetical protein
MLGRNVAEEFDTFSAQVILFNCREFSCVFNAMSLLMTFQCPTMYDCSARTYISQRQEKHSKHFPFVRPPKNLLTPALPLSLRFGNESDRFCFWPRYIGSRFEALAKWMKPDPPPPNTIRSVGESWFQIQFSATSYNSYLSDWFLLGFLPIARIRYTKFYLPSRSKKF